MSLAYKWGKRGLGLGAVRGTRKLIWTQKQQYMGVYVAARGKAQVNSLNNGSVANCESLLVVIPYLYLSPIYHFREIRDKERAGVG